MKRAFNFVLLTTLFPTMAFAQLSGAVRQTKEMKFDTDLNLIFVVKLNNSQEIVTHELVVMPAEIQKLEGMPVEEREKRFGKLDMKKTVVMVVTPKPGVKLVRLSELYQHHHLTNEEQKLTLKIDGRLIKDTTNVIFDENALKSFTAYKDSVAIYSYSYDNAINYIKTHRKNDD